MEVMAASLGSNSLSGLNTAKLRAQVASERDKGRHTKDREVSHDSEFEWYEVVGMHPILCSLSYERALGSASRRITLYGMATRSNKVVQA